ncbi:hypothetical protein AB0O22_38910 [Streptomyces sp. NPDC091204]|uniref:hypothetical protein n=1 Tax=Streptomyces sp. NPDC091204 TaxID=3155299 RepID=UPI003435B5B9
MSEVPVGEAQMELRQALRWLSRRCGEPSLREIAEQSHLSLTTVQRVMSAPHVHRRQRLQEVVSALAAFDAAVRVEEEIPFFNRLWALARAEATGEECGPEPFYAQQTTVRTGPAPEPRHSRPTLMPGQVSIDLGEGRLFVWIKSQD